MNHAKLLDCTLRDGAYLIDKKFGDNYIHGIINGLMNTGVDLIEMGFLQDDGFGEGKTVFLNGKDAEKFVPEDKGNTLFTVLADYSRYSIENLDEYTGKSFDAVRACFFKKERFDVIDFCKTIKEKGYKVFIQPVDILGYSDIHLISMQMQRKVSSRRSLKVLKRLLRNRKQSRRKKNKLYKRHYNRRMKNGAGRIPMGTIRSAHYVKKPRRFTDKIEM